MLHTINNRYQYDPQKDLLGRNAYSKAYFAYDSHTDNYVIMKLFVGEWTELYELTGEVLKLKYLQHPNLLCYLDVFEMLPIEQQDQLPPAVVVITEFIQGMNLATYLEQGNEVNQLKSVFREVLSAIAYLQDNKRVLIDIQPHHVLLYFTEEGIHAKLDILNISQLPIRNFSGGNQPVETPPMTLQNDLAMACHPPESFNPQLYGLTKPSVSANYWAYGVLLYRCLTGALPFGKLGADKRLQELIHDIHTKSLPTEITQIAEPYRSVIVQCLVKDPHNRVQEAASLQELLKEISELDSIQLPPKETIQGVALADNLFLLTSFSLSPEETQATDLIDENVHAYPTLDELVEEQERSVKEENLANQHVVPQEIDVKKVDEEVEKELENTVLLEQEGDGQKLEQIIVANTELKLPDSEGTEATSSEFESREAGSVSSATNELPLIVDKSEETASKIIYTKPVKTSKKDEGNKSPNNLFRIGALVATLLGLLGLFFLVKNCGNQTGATIKGIKPYVKLSKESLIQNMVLIEGGSFDRGQSDPNLSCENCNVDEQPVKTITLSSFYIDPYEISNEQYADFLNWYGSDVVKEGEFKGQKMVRAHKWGVQQVDGVWMAQEGYKRHPIVFVTWYGAFEYARFFGKRLPTEAEWEFAARGGTRSRTYRISGGNDPTKFAWFTDNTDRSRTLGLLAPNELGVYDMSGNVQEWCMDWYHENAYTSTLTTDPLDTTPSRRRSVRGGHWREDQYELYVTNRAKFSPGNANHFTGFRCVMDAEEP